jgi:PEP-CTERM motif
MKSLRYLFALLFVCALSGMARADDFKLGVQDAGLGYQYTGGTLTVPAFGDCTPADPLNNGCVTIWNDTGSTITGLVIDVPNVPILQNDPNCLILDGCSFTLIDLGGGNSEWQYIFTGLDVPYGGVNGVGFDTFTIIETGIPEADFPAVTVTATPEPASLMLLATGLLLCAGFIYRRRLDGTNLGS